MTNLPSSPAIPKSLRRRSQRQAVRVALSLAFVAAARLRGETQPVVTSVYTELAGPRCVSESRNAGATAQRCRGVGGWSLVVTSSDQRLSVTAASAGGTESPLLTSGELVGVTRVGPNAEWRVRGNAERGFTPTAVIVRVDTTETGTDGRLTRASFLAVARVNEEGACVIGKVAVRGNAAAKARRLASEAQQAACLRPTLSQTTPAKNSSAQQH